MSAWRFNRGLVRAGFIAGLAFGAADLLLTWLDPLGDDTPGALLLFYGPMFALWAVASFVTARRMVHRFRRVSSTTTANRGECSSSS